MARPLRAARALFEGHGIHPHKMKMGEENSGFTEFFLAIEVIPSLRQRRENLDLPFVISDSLTLPAEFLSQTLNRPWMRLKIFLDYGPLSRTPECYKKFYYDWQVKTPSPVHYIPEPGIWKKQDNDQITVIQNRPLPLIYPNELHNGLWGGEAVVKGFEKRKPKRRRVAMYWVPKLKSTVVYSEILDKYMNVTVTERALQLIDTNFGLDFYILKTPPADLMSLLALRLKKEMSYAVMSKSFYPKDKAKTEEVYDKYKDLTIPNEDIEWYALTLAEAYRKQLKMEKEEKYLGPYKEIFRKEFIKHLKDHAEEISANEEVKKKGVLERLKFLSKKEA